LRPNPILKVLSTLDLHHVRYLLMGGLYRRAAVRPGLFVPRTRCPLPVPAPGSAPHSYRRDGGDARRGSQSRLDLWQNGTRWPDNDDPLGRAGWKSHRIGEVQIQREQNSVGTYAGIVDGIVVGTGKSLTLDRVHIVPTRFDQRHKSKVYVLVQLELHGSPASVETGIMRSRVISAANANAARMSSGHSDG